MPLDKPIPFGIGWAARDPFGYGGFMPPLALKPVEVDGQLLRINGRFVGVQTPDE